ncbi:hypothetical protein HKX54_07480 [Sulfitobacter sp. M57]|uniref:hypothetical protein n=1 Tax=unclassified Sulfitobacter TaxID=196795 RepID=UPI0023E20C0E|nr:MULTISPECIES: hypothetical protein [unclassified Sulfitobacter]MDF3414293.1 hypothetical protein [Sulfitobacter sp. KE5]MDF3420425.1 hypothetical protein [Sulfitobacter sp. KE43]MDF3432839.1 hypothetical protein [Sulfitobacter sp. KE42]MDF3458479.1 hypothetical protein [Sulfitobacter sp. S74]MDF3462379.1 hypothetical protein [Sulfitobacter sp. Ks18]
MKHALAFVLAVTLTAPAAQAEEDPGPSLMERGAQMFLEGILKEMEPTMEELQGIAEEMGPALREFASEMGPKLTELMAEVEDWSVYLPPEILPNGDIIIRRKPEHPMTPPETPTEPAPQIDL